LIDRDQFFFDRAILEQLRPQGSGKQTARDRRRHPAPAELHDEIGDGRFRHVAVGVPQHHVINPVRRLPTPGLFVYRAVRGFVIQEHVCRIDSRRGEGDTRGRVHRFERPALDACRSVARQQKAEPEGSGG